MSRTCLGHTRGLDLQSWEFTFHTYMLFPKRYEMTHEIGLAKVSDIQFKVLELTRGVYSV